MKLLYAIFLMSSVLFTEFSSIIDLCETEICLMDTSLEGEVEKESKENIEDFSKVKIRQNVNFMNGLTIQSNKDLLSKWSIVTPYLEIHSPPPEEF